MKVIYGYGKFGSNLSFWSYTDGEKIPDKMEPMPRTGQRPWKMHRKTKQRTKNHWETRQVPLTFYESEMINVERMLRNISSHVESKSCGIYFHFENLLPTNSARKNKYNIKKTEQKKMQNISIWKQNFDKMAINMPLTKPTLYQD